LKIRWWLVGYFMTLYLVLKLHSVKWDMVDCDWQIRRDAAGISCGQF
jgi:hypothetical protein